MTLTWRGHVARLYAYFEQGEGLMAKVRGLLVAAASLKILGLPMAWIILGAPLVIVLYAVVGWVWLRHGWYKQATEVALFDSWTPLQVWQAHMTVRALHRLGVDLNGYDPSALPDEYRHILASAKGDQ